MFTATTKIMLTRTLIWAFVLPLIGTMTLICVPGIGWLTLFVIVANLPAALGVIYVTGFIPSLLTATFFFSLIGRFNRWFVSAATCLVSAATAGISWWSTRHFGSTIPGPDSGIQYFMGGIAAIAAAAMALTTKADPGVNSLASARQKRC